MLSPLDDERSAAELTLFVGGFLHTLDVFHVLFGVSEILGKLLVEIGQGFVAGLFAFFNLVEFLFEVRGVLEVKDVFEILDKQIRNHEADFRGHELAADFLRVLTLLNGAENGGVSGKAGQCHVLRVLSPAKLR